MGSSAGIRIEPWGKGDLPLLERLVGDPEMMEHLGGPETAEKIAERQARYERASACFRIVDERSGQPVGWVGYWRSEWREQEVFEVGWAVLPAFQGRGIATAATSQVIALARAEEGPRWMHAFPSVGNLPSNAICRKLGFELLGEHELEYPPGSLFRCNDWRLDLGAAPQRSS